jgi:NMD protein affecting ribosome stability and mRNA decay
MNATELVKLLEVDSWYKLVTREEIADTLRQQAVHVGNLLQWQKRHLDVIETQKTEIEELKTCLIVEQEHNERMVEDRSKYEAQAHAGGVEAGKELAVMEVMSEHCTCYKLGYSQLNDYAKVKAK